MKQRTIKSQVSISGIGIHSGVHTNVKLLPSKENSGIMFVRTDIKENNIIHAHINNLHSTKRSTDLKYKNAQVRTLGETIRLDSRTKLLNPKWYEGMLKSGYEGVRELSNRLNYTLGWSATSGQVDNFVYEETNETFINDEEMRKRLMDLNPNSFRRIVGTLLEVNGRGYWETSDENIEQLKELYQEVEDKIEGVKE